MENFDENEEQNDVEDDPTIEQEMSLAQNVIGEPIATENEWIMLNQANASQTFSNGDFETQLTPTFIQDGEQLEARFGIIDMGYQNQDFITIPETITLRMNFVPFLQHLDTDPSYMRQYCESPAAYDTTTTDPFLTSGLNGCPNGGVAFPVTNTIGPGVNSIGFFFQVHSAVISLGESANTIVLLPNTVISVEFTCNTLLPAPGDPSSKPLYQSFMVPFTRLNENDGVTYLETSGGPFKSVLDMQQLGMANSNAPLGRVYLKNNGLYYSIDGNGNPDSVNTSWWPGSPFGPTDLKDTTFDRDVTVFNLSSTEPVRAPIKGESHINVIRIPTPSNLLNLPSVTTTPVEFFNEISIEKGVYSRNELSELITSKWSDATFLLDKYNDEEGQNISIPDANTMLTTSMPFLMPSTWLAQAPFNTIPQLNIGGGVVIESTLPLNSLPLNTAMQCKGTLFHPFQGQYFSAASHIDKRFSRYNYSYLPGRSYFIGMQDPQPIGSLYGVDKDLKNPRHFIGASEVSLQFDEESQSYTLTNHSPYFDIVQSAPAQGTAEKTVGFYYQTNCAYKYNIKTANTEFQPNVNNNSLHDQSGFISINSIGLEVARYGGVFFTGTSCTTASGSNFDLFSLMGIDSSSFIQQPQQNNANLFVDNLCYIGKVNWTYPAFDTSTKYVSKELYTLDSLFRKTPSTQALPFWNCKNLFEIQTKRLKDAYWATPTQILYETGVINITTSQTSLYANALVPADFVVSITGGGGTGAKGEVKLERDSVTGFLKLVDIGVTDFGINYTSAPTVTIRDKNGNVIPTEPSASPTPQPTITATIGTVFNFTQLNKSATKGLVMGIDGSGATVNDGLPVITVNDILIQNKSTSPGVSYVYPNRLETKLNRNPGFFLRLEGILLNPVSGDQTLSYNLMGATALFENQQGYITVDVSGTQPYIHRGMPMIISKLRLSILDINTLQVPQFLGPDNLLALIHTKNINAPVSLYSPDQMIQIAALLQQQQRQVSSRNNKKRISKNKSSLVKSKRAK